MLRVVLLVLGLVLLAPVHMPVHADGLRVGMSPDYPPLVSRHDGQIVGIEADNMRALGKVINRPMQVVEMPFAELISALVAGKIDVIMSGMSVTPERADQVTFIQSYMRVGQMAILHKDRVADFGQPWAIYQKGVRVGVEPGTTGAEFAKTELPDADVKPYANPDAAFAGLRRGDIDLYVHDAPTSWLLATDTGQGDLISLYSPLTEEYLAWAVRKDDAALAAQLNDALLTMKSSGVLRYILNRWIPVTVEVH